MATKEYLRNYLYEEGKLIVSPFDLITATKSILMDERAEMTERLVRADAEEWAAIKSALDARPNGTSAGSGWISVTLSPAEVKQAQQIAQHMYETQLNNEAQLLKAAQSALPTAGSLASGSLASGSLASGSLAENIQSTFPGDAAAQALIMECVRERAQETQQQCAPCPEDMQQR